MDVPQTASEWSDANFYLSSESSGTVGKWETLPFQRAMLNAMGSPDVQRIDVIKSARVGATKMMMAALGYFLVKKKRSVAFWQPTDSDRDDFSKTEIEPAIRDVPAWVSAFPDFGKKSKLNTLEYKGFIGASLWLKGGTSAKNFRRISPDVVMLDELDAFPLDIDGEGSADSLSWKRAEVSSFRKQIKVSSPKEKGSSQIEASSLGAKAFMRFNVQCPHCGGFSPLEWGGPKSRHGFKWDKGNPETVLYYCGECGSGWPNGGLHKASVPGFWRDTTTGYETKDGLRWTRGGESCIPPRHVAFHVWSAYSPYTTWREIVEDWIGTQGDPLRLKTFVNTTLGETWEAVEGEQIKAAQIKARDQEPMPGVLVVTLGVDVQPDRWELQWLGHCLNGDKAVLAYQILHGEADRLEDWKARLSPVLDREFQIGGRVLKAEAIGIDTGGSTTQTTYDFCALNSGRQVLAMKGIGGDRPIVDLKPAMNWRKKGLAGWLVGTNAAKDILYALLARADGDSRWIFPDGVELPSDYADQITSERRVLKIVRGRRSYQYEKRSQSARNEALDTGVYALAAFEWLRIHRHLNLEARAHMNSDVPHTTGYELF